jgi:undecaprenyl diphosphate synthase
LAKMQQLFSLKRKEDNDVQTLNGPEQVQQRQSVRHIAIIMDGNGRWATKRHLPRLAGHNAGVTALRRVVQCASEENVGMLSVYAFSTENWGRPKNEVDGLMRLFWDAIRSQVADLHREGVRLRCLGRLQDLSSDMQQVMKESMELTRNNTRIGLNVCFNYGGRAELVDAVRQIIIDGYDPDSIDEALISSYLYTRELPDPDLVIRTAGEMRMSNFLTWQSVYSEYYSTPTLWPDFGRDDLRTAIANYQQRCRRFGRLDEPATT